MSYGYTANGRSRKGATQRGHTHGNTAYRYIITILREGNKLEETSYISGYNYGESTGQQVVAPARKPKPEPSQSGMALDAKHYQVLQQQPIEIMQRLMTPEQFKGFLWGNVIKYALRCGQKDNPVKEMQKVAQYAKWYVQVCEGKTIDPREGK